MNAVPQIECWKLPEEGWIFSASDGIFEFMDSDQVACNISEVLAHEQTPLQALLGLQNRKRLVGGERRAVLRRHLSHFGACQSVSTPIVPGSGSSDYINGTISTRICSKYREERCTKRSLERCTREESWEMLWCILSGREVQHSLNFA